MLYDTWPNAVNFVLVFIVVTIIIMNRLGSNREG